MPSFFSIQNISMNIVANMHPRCNIYIFIFLDY